jgi:hypothetical protein
MISRSDGTQKEVSERQFQKVDVKIVNGQKVRFQSWTSNLTERSSPTKLVSPSKNSSPVEEPRQVARDSNAKNETALISKQFVPRIESLLGMQINDSSLRENPCSAIAVTAQNAPD